MYKRQGDIVHEMAESDTSDQWHVLARLSGNIEMYGGKTADSGTDNWNIVIADPDDNTDSIAVVSLRDGSVAVSYTHLDVYKRQDYILPFKLSKEDAVSALKRHYKGKLLLPKLFRDNNHIEELRGIYAVSYTHLDVYKRQAQRPRRTHSARHADRLRF